MVRLGVAAVVTGALAGVVSATPPPVFEGPVTRSTSLVQPQGLAVDTLIDNDAWPDVVVVSTFNQWVAILRNTGAGTWSATNAGLAHITNSPFYVGNILGITERVTTGDVDNDGDVDIIVAGGNGTNGGALILRNDAGTFSRTQTQTVLTGALSIADDVNVYDFNSDGRTDILLAGSSPDFPPKPRAVLMRKEVNGTYTQIVFSLPSNVRGRGTTLTRGTIRLPGVAGRLDAVMGTNCGKFLLLLNDSAVPGNQTVFTAVEQDGPARTEGIAVGHFRTDPKKADIAASNPDVLTGGALEVWHANDTGSGQWALEFNELSDRYSLLPAYNPWGVDVGLLNGDGTEDVVIAHQGGGLADCDGQGGVAIFLGRRNFAGTLRQPGYLFCSDLQATKPKYVKVADMDQDGQQDVVVSNQDTGNIGVLLNRSLVPLP